MGEFIHYKQKLYIWSLNNSFRSKVMRFLRKLGGLIKCLIDKYVYRRN
jgi:hypothetical protein